MAQRFPESATAAPIPGADNPAPLHRGSCWFALADRPTPRAPSVSTARHEHVRQQSLPRRYRTGRRRGPSRIYRRCQCPVPRRSKPGRGRTTPRPMKVEECVIAWGEPPRDRVSVESARGCRESCISGIRDPGFDLAAGCWLLASSWFFAARCSRFAVDRGFDDEDSNPMRDSRIGDSRIGDSG